MTEAIDTNLLVTGQLRTSNNMFGFRGVEWRADRGNFRAIIGSRRRGTVKRSGGHATAIEAALAYDEMAREFYGDLAHLNFPTEEEKKTKQSQRSKGLCSEGHDLNEFGLLLSNGFRNCRKCNLESAREYKQRNPEKVRAKDRAYKVRKKAERP